MSRANCKGLSRKLRTSVTTVLRSTSPRDTEAWRWKVVQYGWIDGFLCSGRDCIAVAYVKLNGRTRIAQFPDKPNPKPTVAGVLANVSDRDRLRIEVHSIFHPDHANLRHCRPQDIGIHGAKAEKVCVSRWTVRNIEP